MNQQNEAEQSVGRNAALGSGLQALSVLLPKGIAHPRRAGSTLRKQLPTDRAVCPVVRWSLPAGAVWQVGPIVRVAADRPIGLASGNARIDQRSAPRRFFERTRRFDSIRD